MRRPATEWLLVPVFLLPLAAVAALALVLASAFDARLASYRRSGADAARTWTERDPDGSAWVVARFAEAIPRPATGEPGWAPFRRGEVTGVVRDPDARPSDDPWLLTDSFPAGLTPESLGDAGVRLAVEAGEPVSRQAGADAPTAAFGTLLTSGDGPSLRAAPLPAATKLWIARRRAATVAVRGSVRGEAVDDAAERRDVAILESLRALDRALDDAGGRLPPGAHAVGRGVALVAPGDGAIVLFPSAAEVPAIPSLPLGTDDAGAVRLAWSVPRAANGGAAAAAHIGGETLWSGPLATPLAGSWSLVRLPGAAWWRGGVVGRWAAPVAFGALAFLLVPTALLVAMRRQRRLDEARARFVTELAHDLRTPVAALRLHADLLAQGRAVEADRGKHADVVAREAARLSALLANLLDFARLERGARPFEKTDLDVGEVARDAVREFTLLFPKRAGDVSVACGDGLVVAADRAALARSLANLLDNAGKFTTPGTAIRVRAERSPAGGARVVVEDDGPGIAPADRSRVFRLYERGSAAATNAAPGTGLGLALVRELVQGMGGRVTLLDTARGAAFEIVLGAAT